MSTFRAIRTAVLAIEKAEGAGASVRRALGFKQLRNLSPFLLLDHFVIPAGGGFPEHPHRGQETITYVLQGSVDHEDFTGSSGTIGPGDLQFMTAGRGIMHAEMPRPSPDGSPVIGVQLWVDLPKDLKFTAPRYRDLRASSIPVLDLDDKKVHIKVISGKSHGVDSEKELAYTPVWILDVEIRPGGKVTQELPIGWTAFAYILSGNSSFGPGEEAKSFGKFHNVIFEQEGDMISASVPETADENGRFLLVAGPPLDQKIVQYGSFVLNSLADAQQAQADFVNFENGFERGKGWRRGAAKRTSKY